jgi:hypothetical protein
MDKVMQSMSRQFGGGKIVNFDEASQSQSEAMQFEKQIRMLQQGPLGGMVKDRESAERLLDAMRKRQEGGPQTNIDSNILSKSIDTGTKLQQMSYTELSHIRSDLSAIRRQADVTNYGFIQNGMAARAGNTQLPGDAQAKQRLVLSGTMEQSSIAAGQAASDYTRGIKQGNPTANALSSAGLKSAQNLFKTIREDIPNAAMATFESLKQAIDSGKPEDIAAAREKLRTDIRTKKQAAYSAGQHVEDAVRTNAQTGVSTNVPNNVAPTSVNNQNLNIHVTGTFQVQMPDGSVQTISPQMRVSNPTAGQQ